MLDVARTVNDLRVPPGNRLEKLVGDRAGQYSSGSTTSTASASPGPTPDRSMSRSSTTTDRRPSHDDTSARSDRPGEILAEEFLGPLGISQYRLAQATGLSQTHIGEIVRGKRRITPDAGLPDRPGARGQRPLLDRSPDQLRHPRRQDRPRRRTRRHRAHRRGLMLHTGRVRGRRDGVGVATGDGRGRSARLPATNEAVGSCPTGRARVT